MKVYYNADGAILGRIGSVICKELLKGKEVFVINCEKALISGDKQEIIGNVSWWKNLGARSQKGPKASRSPDRLMKRMIRGMLPWDRTRGREAYKRLRCYLGNGDLTEEEVKLAKSIEVKMPIKYIQLKELGELI